MLAIKYTLFAVISTLINLLLQYLSLLAYSGSGSLYIAMFFGTIAGLATKYFLDKNYIFYHVPTDRKDDTRKFVVYSFMGGYTTILFWGTELLFDALLQSSYAKYLGAVIGLTMGYLIKYFLDKKYVFVHSAEVAL